VGSSEIVGSEDRAVPQISFAFGTNLYVHVSTYFPVYFIPHFVTSICKVTSSELLMAYLSWEFKVIRRMISNGMIR
jgi:hypothetical protein